MNIAQHILIFGVRCYRWVLSPAKAFLFGPLGRCRFTPSCSEYALEAVGRHGARAGSWLALKRIVRCHPWGGCGHDPVPAVKSEIQRPKSEGNPKAEIRIRARSLGQAHPGFRIWSRGRPAHSQPH